MCGGDYCVERPGRCARWGGRGRHGGCDAAGRRRGARGRWLLRRGTRALRSGERAATPRGKGRRRTASLGACAGVVGSGAWGARRRRRSATGRRALRRVLRRRIKALRAAARATTRRAARCARAAVRGGRAGGAGSGGWGARRRRWRQTGGAREPWETAAGA